MNTYSVNILAHMRHNSQSNQVVCGTRAAAQAYMQYLESKKVCAEMMVYSDRDENGQPSNGRTIGRNFPNPYAISSYDTWFEIEALYESGGDWRSLYHQNKLY